MPDPFYGLAFVRKDGDKTEVLEFVPYTPAAELQVLAVCENYLREEIQEREARVIVMAASLHRQERLVPAFIRDQQQKLLENYTARLARLETELRPVLEEYAESCRKMLESPPDDGGFDMEE